MKTKNFQNSHEKRHIPHFLAYENFTRIFLRSSKWQEGNWKLWNFKIPKQKTFKVFRRKSNTLSPPFETSHEKIKDPKNDKKVFEENTKTKNFQSSHEKTHIPHFLTCETSHKKYENPQNDKKKIEDSKTSKYENKKLSKFTRRKANTPSPPLLHFTQIFLKTHKMTKRKIENSGTSK